MATYDDHQAVEAAVFRKKLDTMVAAAVDVKIEPPLPTPPPILAGHTALSDDDYEVAVIANIHVRAAGVQNIRSLISVTLDLSSTYYAQWRDNVVLTLGHYSLFDHVLMDTT
jgi:hypothetical protein